MTGSQERPKKQEEDIPPNNFHLAIQICDYFTYSIGNSVGNKGIDYLRYFKEWEIENGPICRDSAYINDILITAGGDLESRIKISQSEVKLSSLRTKAESCDLTTKDRLSLAKASNAVKSASPEELVLLSVESQRLNRDFGQAAHTVLSLAYLANLSRYDPDDYASKITEGIPALVDFKHHANQELFSFFTDLSSRYGLSKEEVFQAYHRFFYTNGFNQLLSSCSPDLWTFDRGLFSIIYTYFDFKEAVPQIDLTPGDARQDRLGIDLYGKDPSNGHLYYIQAKGQAKMQNGLPVKDLTIYSLVNSSNRLKLIQHIVKNAGVDDENVISGLNVESDRPGRDQVKQLLESAKISPASITRVLGQIATLDSLLSQARQDGAIPLWVVAPSTAEFLIPEVKTYYKQYLGMLELLGEKDCTLAMGRLVKNPDFVRVINYTRLDSVFDLKSYLSLLNTGDAVLSVSPGKISPAYNKLKKFPQYSGLKFFCTNESYVVQPKKYPEPIATCANISEVGFLRTFAPILLNDVEAGNIEKFSLILADNLFKYVSEPGQDETPALANRLYLLSLIGSLKPGGQLLIHDDDTQKTVEKSQLDLYADYRKLISQLPSEFIVTVETRKNRTGSYLVCTRKV